MASPLEGVPVLKCGVVAPVVSRAQALPPVKETDDEILFQTAPILLRNRSAYQKNVRLHSRSGGTGSVARRDLQNTTPIPGIPGFRLTFSAETRFGQTAKRQWEIRSKPGERVGSNVSLLKG